MPNKTPDIDSGIKEDIVPHLKDFLIFKRGLTDPFMF